MTEEWLPGVRRVCRAQRGMTGVLAGGRTHRRLASHTWPRPAQCCTHAHARTHSRPHKGLPHPAQSGNTQCLALQTQCSASSQVLRPRRRAAGVRGSICMPGGCTAVSGKSRVLRMAWWPPVPWAGLTRGRAACPSPGAGRGQAPTAAGSERTL